MSEQTLPRRTLPCPVCAAPKTRAKKRKTAIDVCEAHGVWLDAGELEAITRRVEDMQRRAATLRTSLVEQASRDGKLAGWLFGPLAFLFDLTGTKRTRR